MGRIFGILVVLALAAAGLTLSEAAAEAAGSTDWAQVSAGSEHTCAVTEAGRLFCWGDNASGELGIGTTGGMKTKPKEISGGGTDWVAVAAGHGHTCGIRDVDDLWCWGSDSDGQLGNDEGGDSNVPVVVDAALAFTAVAAGGAHTCGLTDGQIAYCWGADVVGQLGDGDDNEADEQVPVPVAGGATDWATIDAGNGFTCASQADLELFCWGGDGFGQLGNDASFATQYSPAEVAGGTSDWSVVSAGFQFACARKNTGHLFCWGSNSEGELGDDSGSANSNTPVEVFGARSDWSLPSTGENFACATRTSGRLYCWGNDFDGQVGDGPPKQSRPKPTQVAGHATNWESVAAGDEHACAIKQSGKLYCWGANDKGQLGIGNTKKKKAPEQVKPHA